MIGSVHRRTNEALASAGASADHRAVVYPASVSDPPPSSRWRSVAVCAIRMHSCPRGGADEHAVRTHKVSICIHLD